MSAFADADAVIPGSTPAVDAKEGETKTENMLEKIDSITKEGNKVCVLMKPDASAPATAGGTRRHKRKGGKKSKKRSAKGRKSSRKSSKKNSGGGLSNYKTGGSCPNRLMGGKKSRKQ